MTATVRRYHPNSGRLLGKGEGRLASVLQFKSFWVYCLSLTFLATPLACSYKPAYLQKSEKTPVAQRWKVQKIDPSRLSSPEASVFEKMGPPQFIRFYRKLDPDRERVYMWIYTEPVRLVSFIDGKAFDYVLLDDNPSPLNDYQKKWLFWGGISGGTVVALGLLSYYLFGKK
jgi:hypothetical protein